MNIKLKVKVLTKCSNNEIVGFENGMLKVKLTAVPKKGLANEALITLLSRALNVPKSAIAILKGTSSSSKILCIEGISGEGELRRRIS